MMTALMPYCLRTSCSGSAAQLRKVTTSLAIWEVVAGVPNNNLNRIPKIMGSKHTIVVFDKAVEENAGHRDSTAGEERIVVHAFTDFDTSGGVDVTSEKREDVVLPYRSI